MRDFAVVTANLSDISMGERWHFPHTSCPCVHGGWRFTWVEMCNHYLSGWLIGLPCLRQECILSHPCKSRWKAFHCLWESWLCSIWNVNSECHSDTNPGVISFVFIAGESVGMWVSLKCWRKQLIWMILENLLDLTGQSQIQSVINIAAFMEASKNTVKTVIFELIRAY